MGVHIAGFDFTKGFLCGVYNKFFFYHLICHIKFYCQLNSENFNEQLKYIFRNVDQHAVKTTSVFKHTTKNLWNWAKHFAIVAASGIFLATQ